MPQVWIVRAGRGGGYEATAFKHQIVAVGWPKTSDLTSRSTQSEIHGAVQAAYPDVEPKSVQSYAVQLFAFRCHMEKDDLVLLLRRSSPDVAVGWITGPYHYRTDLGPGMRHVRSVDWVREDLPRAVVERELLNLPALTTIYRINQADAVERLLRIARESSGRERPVRSIDVGGEALATTPKVSEAEQPFVNLQRNLNYARSLATAGEHLEKLEVGAFEVSDVFRAAWVQSVAALDHWVRQEVRTRMLTLALQPGVAKPKSFSTFPMSLGLLERVHAGHMSLVEAIDAQMGRTHRVYQNPDKIKDGFALVSHVTDLWGSVATVLSERAVEDTKLSGADVRARLLAIANRRHKIAHEYDEDPEDPTRKQPIDAATTSQTIDWIEQFAEAILVVLDQK